MVAIVLYVLSEGPVCRFTCNNKGSLCTVSIYLPVHELSSATGLHNLHYMYLHLWLPELIDKHGEPIDGK